MTMMATVHRLGAVQRRLPRVLLAGQSPTARSIHVLPLISSSGRTFSLRAATIRLPQHYVGGGCTTASRFMSSAAPQEADDEANDDAAATIEQPALDASVLANIYNHQRAHYNKAVSSLRKQYHDEYLAQRERERKRKSLEDAQKQRAVLERKRAKAMRSASNADRQLRTKEARRVEWEGELAATQRERDAKKELYRKARQRIVDELEAECHLWLTSPKEVEKALGNPTASQILWARPGGMIGAPSGLDTGFGDHGDFWRYECHTWDSRPIYKDPKETMLEELENISYLMANNSALYWTKERIEEHEVKEQEARLRSIVREEGRRSLLNKQRDMMRDLYGNDNNAAGKDGQKGGRLPPTAMPAPKLDYLADYEAQEREGVEILKRDPRKFFLFESDLPDMKKISGGMGSEHGNEDGSGEDGGEGSLAMASIGASSLGRPIGLRNPFFNDQPSAFPLRMGRDLPPDTRTEKEKKRDERQERMVQAAEEAALAAAKGSSYEVAMAADEDSLDDGSEDVDYEKAEEEAEKELWADQEEYWSETDRKVFDSTPPFARLTPDDVDWIIEQLSAKATKIQDRLDFEDTVRRKEMEKSMSSDAVTKPIESMEDVDRYVMEGLGYDMDAIEKLVQELTPEQSSALEDIDFTGRAGITAEDMTSELGVVPGLTEEQIQALVGMEMSLLMDEKLKNLH